jgi:dTDP-4-amino-4,6-dideoxygalactose transaminase
MSGAKPIPLHKVFTPKNILAQAAQVIESGYIGQGAVVEEFEQALQNKLDSLHVLTISGFGIGSPS